MFSVRIVISLVLLFLYRALVVSYVELRWQYCISSYMIIDLVYYTMNFSIQVFYNTRKIPYL